MVQRLLLLLIPIVALIGWLMARGAPAPEVPFTSPRRETLVSTLTTNGRVDPYEWAAVHSETAGPVADVHVVKGQIVSKGQAIATISAGTASAELSSAESRVNAAQAELDTLSSGGRATELAEIQSGLQRATADLANSQKEVDVLTRLVAKGAATQSELTAAQNVVRQAQQQIDSFARRRAALVTQPDRRAAEARLSEAQSGVTAATRRLSQSLVRAQIGGEVYALNIKPGSYVDPATEIARVGRLDRVRVTVFVDEPELGRVSKGMPVTITWDALPGRSWRGEVESVPLQVVPLGTRQVGEVVCAIENSDRSLIPGTNVNAEIRSREVQSALTIPKEVVRRTGTDSGVFKLVDDKVVWQKVKLGVASVTRIQVLDGLSESDRVALPVETPLKSGDRVRPITTT